MPVEKLGRRGWSFELQRGAASALLVDRKGALNFDLGFKKFIACKRSQRSPLTWCPFMASRKR